MDSTKVSTAAIRIGCSGWVYKHWRDIFYPAGLSQTRWFEHYADEFPIRVADDERRFVRGNGERDDHEEQEHREERSDGTHGRSLQPADRLVKRSFACGCNQKCESIGAVKEERSHRLTG